MTGREWLLRQVAIRRKSQPIRPPRPITRAEADQLAERLREALAVQPALRLDGDIVRCGCIGRYSECRCGKP